MSSSDRSMLISAQYLAASRKVTLRPWPPNAVRRARHVVDLGRLALVGERRLAGAGQPPDDLEVLGEDRQARVDVGVRRAECLRLRGLEPGTEAQDQAAAADRIERAAHLRGEEGVPERRVDDREADRHAGHGSRQRRRDREEIEDQGVPVPLREHVLAEPQGVEAELLRQFRGVEDAVPGPARRPAVELVEVPLRKDDAGLHAAHSCRHAGCCAVPRPEKGHGTGAGDAGQDVADETSEVWLRWRFDNHGASGAPMAPRGFEVAAGRLHLLL
jgi:hypothetical protein